jgi:twitching motility protein PilT
MYVAASRLFVSRYMPISEPSAFSEKLQDLLALAVSSGASDVHLAAGYPPVFRIHGNLIEQDGGALSGDEIRSLLWPALSPESQARYRSQKCVDCALSLLLDGKPVRFRVNMFHAGGAAGACLRVTPSDVPSFEWADFPPDLANRLAFLLDGLVIVTGATGCGKTTTLAMIVNLLNRAGDYRIITIEDPVEYVLPKEKNSLVTQCEVGVDVLSFADGLKYGLRQDPDVILVGEVRDRETAQMALSAAETGHLVFTTLHTRDAKGAIGRYADFFPLDVQREMRQQLALSLRCVVAQRLLPGPNPGDKRNLALEVLFNTNPIASAIRFGKLESVDNYLITNREEGMLSFDETVRRLYKSGRITRAVAERNVRELSMLNR